MPDASFDFVAQNQGLVRSLPLVAGAGGFAGLLLNRALSGVSGLGRTRESTPLPDTQVQGAGSCPTTECCTLCSHCRHKQQPEQIAPVVDASSSQSRADVLGILLSAVLLLTGLQWLALKPKAVDAVSGCVCGCVLPQQRSRGALRPRSASSPGVQVTCLGVLVYVLRC